MKDIGSLSHTKWECKYHVVFIPKYRRKAMYPSLVTLASAKTESLAVSTFCSFVIFEPSKQETRTVAEF